MEFRHYTASYNVAANRRLPKCIIWAMVLFLAVLFLVPPTVEAGSSGDVEICLSCIGEYAAEPAAGWNVRDAVSGQSDPQFRQIQGNSFERGLSRGTYWIRVRLRDALERDGLSLSEDTLAAAAANGVLYLDYSNIDEIDVYVPVQKDGDLYYRHLQGGWTRGFDGDDAGFVFPVFELPTDVGLGHYLAVRVQSDYITNFRMAVASEQTFERTRLRVTAFLYFTLGIFLAVAAMNFLLWYQLRDRQYLLLFFYVVSLAIYQNGITGTLHVVLPETALFLSATVVIWAHVGFFNGLRFVHSFLAVDTYLPYLSWLYRLLWSLNGVAIVLALAGLRFHANVLAYIVGAVVPILLVYTAGASWRNGHRLSKYYLLASGLLLAGVVVFVLRGLGVVSHGFVPTYALSAAGAGEVVLFSLALAERVRALEREKAGLQKSQQQLAWASLTDELTGISNRRHFYQLGMDLQRQGQEQRGPLCIMYIDIDHFKRINDTYGHREGDKVLKRLANLLVESVRDSDHPARIGGEEFAVLMPDIDWRQCVEAAERIRQALADEEFSLNGHRVAVTISIGVAELHTGETIHRCVDRADRALYRAKAQGRNRVVSDEKP